MGAKIRIFSELLGIFDKTQSIFCSFRVFYIYLQRFYVNQKSVNQLKAKYLILLFAFIVGLAACHDGNNEAGEGRSYTVEARFEVDSTVILDHMVLYADSHVSLSEDSLFLSPEGAFSIERRTPGLDELYLCSDGGELCRFYAVGGIEVRIALSGRSDSLVVEFDSAANDSVNPWLLSQVELLADAAADERRAVVDSLCHLMPSDVRCALLLREEIAALSDSLFVRRCLGALDQQAKPEWLLKSIDDLLTETSAFLTRSRRQASSKFQVNDTTVFDMGATRSDYLLVYCWADYDQASVDSLKVLAELVGDEYDMKRLTLFSVCLHASDSTAWRQQVKDLDGTHVWLPAGLADSRVRAWGTERVPFLMLCDMYNNQQRRNAWGKELRDALGRLPNRSGFAHTPKTKPHHGR